MKDIFLCFVPRFALPRIFYKVTQLFGDISVSFSSLSRRYLESNCIKLCIVTIGVTHQEGFYLCAARHARIIDASANGCQQKNRSV